MHTAAWSLRGGAVFTPSPFGILGIVNITPDSFYDGGRHAETETAVAHARRLLDDGAHILDLGAASSRPGSLPLDAAAEQQRLLPVLRALKSDDAPILSVDTWRASTARAALEAGADIINDIAACALDPALREILVHYKPGYVLTHGQGRGGVAPYDPNGMPIMDQLLAFFDAQLRSLTAAGLPEDRIVLDPGIGFDKAVQQNVKILRDIRLLRRFGRPVLMGLSMKSLFGALLGLPTDQRGAATQVATALLARQGVALHRVHDVAATARTLRLVQLLDPSS